MNGVIPAGRTRLAAAAIAIAVAALTVGVPAAGASPPRPVYSNLKTVPGEVNGLPNQDTYSAAPFEFPFGGLVQFSPRPGVIRSLTAEVDSFTCEHGSYIYENCYTGDPGRRFSYTLTAHIYEVTAGDEPGALVASSTRKFKIPYRPSTNVDCPPTPEGKGFGRNCDVGGYLDTITFKKFAPVAVLPEKAIITITDANDGDPASEVVNVGTQTSYKEWDEALGPGYEGFIPEGPLNEGKPSVGSDPLPEETIVTGKLTGGQADFQPVFEVTAKA
jgi:hypothetical protein